MSNIYATYITELKRNFSPMIINKAIRVWKSLNFSDESISNKVDELQERLERATKNEFIVIMQSYDNREFDV